MREITRSVKVALKCLIAVVLVVLAQKRLFIHSRCKFRHRRSIRRPRFPIRVQHFGDLALFYVNFLDCPPFLLPVCLTYWPRNYTTRVDPTSIIPTKFEVDMTIHCRVIAFLSIRHVTLWPWLLTFWPWTVDVHGGSRYQPCYQVWWPYAYQFLIYES